MEDPIRFDAWCTLGDVFREQVISDLLASRPNKTELDLRIEINRAANSATPILAATGMSWSRAQELRACPPAWAAKVELFQEGLLPTDTLWHCDEHGLFYGGCLGCHVCSGFYVPT